MTIRYKCEKCGSVLKIKDRLAGTDGKCPKCATGFRVPEASPDESAPTDSESEVFSEEDAIFGKDFFSVQEKPRGQRSGSPATTATQVDSDSEIEQPGPESRTVKPFASARPSSVDNSSNIAGQLLSKTGKKNRPDDWQDPDEEEGGYDFSAINYLLLHRVIPGAVAAVVLTTVFYYFFADMMASKSDLPPLARVSGVVKLDGNPAESAEVSFEPFIDREKKSNSGSASIGWSDKTGRYTLSYTAAHQGAVIGKHNVTITIGPQRFLKEAEVKDGDNQIDFEVATPREAPQK